MMTDNKDRNEEYLVYLGNGYFAIDPPIGERLSIWDYGSTRKEDEATTFPSKESAIDFIKKYFSYPVELPQVAFPRIKGSSAPLPF